MSKKQFLQTPNGFQIVEEYKLVDELSAGAYTLLFDPRSRIITYKPLDMQHDNLIDLPSAEFTTVINEMNHFLKPETKQSYREHGFLYKRSIFLHGLPGTGKTCIVNKVSQQVVKNGGIVIFNDNPNIIQLALDELKEAKPDILTLVLLEEFDELMGQGYETSLLKMLDGQIQKPNTIYLATTNFLNKIPKRILRPGRFSRLIQVQFPSLEARTKYVTLVSKDQTIVKELSEKSEGFSIDELKEAVLSINCLGYSIDETVARIKTTQDITSKLKRNAEEKDVDDDFELDPDQEGL